MRSWIAAFCLPLALFLLQSHPAQATQIEARTLPQLGSEAQLVVQGSVRGVRSYWNEAHTRILTEVTFEVAAAYKGEAPSVVKLVQMGGVVDGVRMTMHGAPQWTQQQPMLLFLEPATQDAYRLSGFTQGRFELSPDPTTGELMAKRSLFGAELVGKDGKGALELSLNQLLAEASLSVEVER